MPMIKKTPILIRKGQVYDDLRDYRCPVVATVISVIRTESPALYVLKFWVKHRKRWCFELVNHYALELNIEAKRFNKRKPSNKR